MKIIDFIMIIVGVIAIGGIIISWPVKTVQPKLEVIPPIIKQPEVVAPTPTIPEVVTPIPTLKLIPNNPINGTIPIIIIQPITAPAGTIFINETIMQDDTPVMDAECELDIIDERGVKVVDFRSFYNDGNGAMQYTWDNATKGTYTLSQYCWRGQILDLNKIYSNSTIIVT